MRKMNRWAVMAASSVVAACALTACAPSDGDDAGDSPDAVEVAVITSETGPLGAYGKTYLEGFKAGLDDATDGTGEVDGTKIQVSYADDAGDPEKATQAFKEQAGKGVKIVAGTASSGIAVPLAELAAQNKVLYISGPAAADALTGMNEYTFRSGRQSMQDVATAATFLDDVTDKKVVVFAQDNVFGQGNAKGVEAVLGAEGADVSSILVGEDQTEFTTFAKQLGDAKPDLVFVAWAGATSGAMWQALDQQGIFELAPVVTGLGDAATFGAYGAASEKISFLSHYFPGAPDNDVNTAMIKAVEKAGGTPDLFTPDGYVAALMVVEAIKEGKGDVDAMVEALNGYSFDGPKGETTIREGDHAVLQEMYQAKLVKDGDSFAPELVKTISADEVAPPEAS